MKKLLLTIGIASALFMSSCSKPAEKVVTQDTSQNATQNTNDNGEVRGSKDTPEQGGVGFEKIAGSLGYVTAVGKDYTNPNTTKGGTWHDFLEDYPGVFRPYGPDSASMDVFYVTNLVYGAKLVYYNYETGGWERGLADYWKFSDDKKTLWVRINPNAKWSDGKPFTADDVIATHNIIMDEAMGEPLRASIEKRFNVEKESDHILKFTIAENLTWIMWIQALDCNYFPEEYLSKIDAKTYTEKYARDFMPSLGPYTFDKEKSVDNELISLKRNPNYFADAYEEKKNMYNFDRVEYKVVRDSNIAQEALKKGELDWYVINDPKIWHDDFSKQNPKFEPIARNMLVKRMMFNGTYKRRSYFVFNSRRKPFDDIRVRLAISMGIDKNSIIDKITYGDGVKYFSIAALTPLESKNLDTYDYDPQKASALLDEAGYNVVAEDGIRQNAAGERLEFEISFYTQDVNEKIHNVFQSNMKDIGIKINLVKTDFPNIIKKLGNRDFNMIRIGNQPTFGYPEFDGEFYSYLADQENSNNMGGFKSKEADDALTSFMLEFDAQKRIAFAHKLDELVSASHIYIELYTYPFISRYIHWNKFNTATGYNDIDDSPIKFWSVNKDLEAQLEKAKADTNVQMQEGDLIVDPFSMKPADFQVTDY